MHDQKKELIVGPLRVLPGRLSVSRTFGDPEAKLESRGGNPNVVIATPEIYSFKLNKDHDFIVLGSDGIFDKINSDEVSKCVWNTTKGEVREKATNVHHLCGYGAEYILKNSMHRQSLDNITVVLIAFTNFKRTVFGHSTQDGREGGPSTG